jgi:hypothetical protein
MPALVPHQQDPVKNRKKHERLSLFCFKSNVLKLIRS